MMKQLRAEFYKLTHSHMLIVLPLLFVLAFFILTKTSNGVYILYCNYGEESIGFFAFLKAMGASTFIAEDIAHTVISTSWTLWIFILIFSLSFFYKDFQEGTINLALGNGTSLTTIFLTKCITIISYFTICYIIYCIVSSLYTNTIMKATLNMSDILLIIQILILCYIILISFIFTCLFLASLFNSIFISAILLCAGNFISSYLIITTWAPGIKPPLYYLWMPMYYLMSLSHRTIPHEILIYSAVNIIILPVLTLFLLKRRYLK